MSDWTREQVLAMADEIVALHPSFQDAMDGADISLRYIAAMLRDYAALLGRWEALRHSLRMIDFPTAWSVCRETKTEQHHEACSYRQADGGFLCDCAALEGAQAFRKHTLSLMARLEREGSEGQP